MNKQNLIKQAPRYGEQSSGYHGRAWKGEGEMGKGDQLYGDK